MALYGCDMCSFVALQHASLVDHVCTIHREHPNFLVYCESCLRSYTKWDSYKKHRSRGCKGGQTGSHVLTGEAEDLSMSITDNDPVDDDDGVAPMFRPPQQWHEAAFILSVKEQHVLSQAAVDHVISSAKSLVSNVFDALLNTLTDRLPEDSMNHFLSQNPVSKLLGQRRVWKVKKRKRCIVEFKDTFQYIPILESLKVSSIKTQNK